MDAAVIVVVCALAGLIVLVFWRWSWLRNERKKLSAFSAGYAERFDSGNHEDEDDKTYRGRIISRLRSRLVEGRVEIHWEYRPEFIHRGFVLAAKCRRNEGEWQPLAMEPFQDSGSWIECFNYGESRSYLFVVKKRHHFFFGLFGEEPDEIVYDQISFSVRKGKYLKEKKELMRDRRELLGEVKEYVQAEQEIRRMVNGRAGGKQEARSGDSRVTKLEKRREALTELSEYIDRETEKINARSDWSDEKKSQEIQRLQELASEAALDD